MEFDTIVVGAGVSGLAYAHARGPDADVCVLEAGDAPGGLVRTCEVDGPVRFRFERGPESIAPGAAELRALAHDLGVATVEASPAAKRRYVVDRGRLCAVPLSPKELLRSRLLGVRAKVGLLTEPFRRLRPGTVDGSIDEFARRRFGHEIAAKLVDPFVAGVHAGDPTALSFRACFPALAAAVESHGSVLRAARRELGPREPMWRPEGGMSRLTDAFAASLPVLRTRHRVERVERAPDGERWVVHAAGREFVARRVVIALPLRVSRELLRGSCAAAARVLDEAPAEDIVSIVHVYARADVAHPLDGFGYLVPTHAGLPHLGTLFSSSIDPSCVEPGHVVLRTMLGGARDPAAVHRRDGELLAVVRSGVRPLLGIRGEPRWTNVDRYPGGLPRFDLDHVARLDRWRRALPETLRVLGNFTSGIGLPALVREARDVAAADAATVPRRAPAGTKTVEFDR